MPRRPRVDLAGFHHVINRGSNRGAVFKQEADYETFLKIVCKAAKAYKVIVHDYCLMSNHYHLLIETRSSNLSLFMKQIQRLTLMKKHFPAHLTTEQIFLHF